MPDRAEVMPQLEGPRISATRREPWFAAAGLRAAVISAAPAGLLIALVVVAYLPAFGAKFAFDDRQEVVENSLLTSWWGLWQIWTSPYANIQYYPLTYTTFWVEWHLWGLKPAAYHVTNILLHGLNAVLFWRLLRRLGVPGALLAAAVFAVHPVHVESVAWVTERKNVLSSAFALASLLAYLRYLGLGEIPASGRRSRQLYFLALLLFGMALLSKTVVCVLPPVILLLIWWKRNRLTGRDLYPLIPMFVLAFGLGLVTMYVEHPSVGGEVARLPYTLLERSLIAGRAVWFYLGKLLWPAHLTLIYPRWNVSSPAAWRYLLPAAIPVVIVALWTARRRIGRGPLAAALIFLGALAPALGFIDIQYMQISFVADRFQYLPSMALLALAAAAFVRAAAPLPAGPRRIASSVAMAALLGTLGTLTWRQSTLYRDPRVLWEHTVAKNPAAAMAWINLGMERLETGDAVEGLRCYHRAVEAEPDRPYTHTELGFALVRQQKCEEALPHFQRALEIQGNYVPALANQALAMIALGREEAIPLSRKAVALRPDVAGFRVILATALVQHGDVDAAESEYRHALRLNPSMSQVHFEFAGLLERRGKLAEAIEHYRQAADMQPDAVPPRYQLAVALIAAGRHGEAAKELETVLRVEPDNVRAAQRLEDARRAVAP